MVGSIDVGWKEGKVTEGTFEGVRLGIENVGSMLGGIVGNSDDGHLLGDVNEGKVLGSLAVGTFVGYFVLLHVNGTER